MVHSEVAAYDSGRPGPLLGRPAMLASHMSALSQSQLISQMGIRSGIAHSSPSPPGSKSATPSPSSSTQEEESDAHFKVRDVVIWKGVASRCLSGEEGTLPGHGQHLIFAGYHVDFWSES